MDTLEHLQRDALIRAAGPQTWHIMHIILALLSVGIWIPIWLIVTISNHRERERLVRNDRKNRQ